MKNACSLYYCDVSQHRRVIIFFFLCLSLIFSPQLKAQQQIVINELGIAPNQNNSGTGSEFVELFNKSGCSVNIGCYVVVYSGSDPFFGNPTAWTITIPANTILQPDSFYLIGGGGGKSAYPIGPWQTVTDAGSPWKNIWGANGKDIADLDISTSSNSALNTIPGLLIDNSGQVTLLKPDGTVESSVSYNMGNNPNSYPGGFSNASGSCSSIKLSNPGASPNNFNNQLNGKFNGFIPGIYLDSSGVYQRTFSTDNPNLTPGKPNITQLKSSGGIAAPTAIASQQPTCSNPTGSITITSPTGAGYSYSINGTTYQTGLNFTGLFSGNYNVTVKNPGGCISLPTVVSINTAPTPPVNPSISVSQPSCSNTMGSIIINSPTGSGLTYSINGTTYQASTTFNSLSPGQYNVTVKDAGGCISSATSVTINPAPSAPQAPTVSTIQPTCSTATGTINISSPTGAGLTYSINGTTYQASTIFNSVSPGQYNVTVKDAGGCISSATSVTINAASSAPQAPTVSTIQPTCSTATGTISITSPTGAGLSYSINGTTYQLSTTFNSVSQGQYNVTVKDAGGCISSSTSVTINAAPSAPQAPTVSTIQPTCSTATGTITINSPTGAGLTYSINGTTYQASITFISVSPGQYNVTVKDAGGCISSATSVTINAASSAPQAPTVSTIQPTCSTATGTISITSPIGAGLTYSINGTTYQASTTFNSVSQGKYNVTVKDLGGCISSATSVTINAAPSRPTAPIASVTQQPTCANSSGTITVSSPIGNGYGYSINGISYQASTTFNSVAPGQYNVTVKDAAGCISTPIVITVNGAAAAPLAPNASVSQQPTCSNPTGIISISSPTGSGLSYSINGTTYQGATIFNSVTPGQYNVTAKDAGGCISSATQVRVDPIPAAPNAPTVSTVQPTCSTSTGSINIASPTGSGLTYSMNGTNYQTSATFNPVSPGQYNVTVKDNSGCISSATQVVINQAPVAPEAPMVSIIQPTCSMSTGTIDITAPSGSGLSYSINGTSYQTSKNFNGLSTGQYNVTVKDNSGCISKSTVVTINASPLIPPAPTVMVTQPLNCTNSTGIINITSPLGVNYSYSNDGIHYQVSPIFQNMAPGQYFMTARNIEGCASAETIAIINGGPSAPTPPLAIVTKQPTCSDSTGTITITGPSGVGFAYSVNGVNYTSSPVFYGLPAGQYNVTDKDGKGCTSSATVLIIYRSISSIEPKPVANIIQEATCISPTATISFSSPIGVGYSYSINGTDYQSSPTFNGLTPGQYSLYAKNAGGCNSLPSTLTINAPVSGAPMPTLSIKQRTCDDSTGSIEITSPTGPGFMYSTDGNTFQISPIFKGLAPGNYNVEVKNSDGCISAGSKATISPEIILQSVRYPTVNSLSFTPANLQARSISAIDSYVWMPTVGLNNYSIANPIFNYNKTTEYLIQITSVAGCRVIDTVVVKVLLNDSLQYNGIYVPTAFSPNNDGKNDKLTPHFSKVKEYKYFRVFNRWGQKIFQTNKEGEGWDGTYKGVSQPPGIFLWTLEIILPDGRNVAQHGSFILIR